jgi:DNA helicase-4
MWNRIRDKIWIELDVMTFHKLWKNIIEKTLWKKINILNDNDKKYFRENIYNNLITDIHKSNPELFKDFFSYLLKPIHITLDFDKLWDLDDYRIENNITTLKERIENKSLRWELLKSIEEVEIANFLFLNWIKYSYEKPYKLDTSSSEFWQYRPDFYLDDYDIYLEHFWIDKRWNVPKFFGDWVGWYDFANKKYQDWIKWKTELHKKNNTKLITTYSYENSDWILLISLHEKLLNKWVKIRKVEDIEIIKSLTNSMSAEYSSFIDLVFTFLSLFKSNWLNFSDLEERKNNTYKIKNQEKRASIFINIFKIIYDNYESYLNKLSTIDFDDMINESTKYIENNNINLNYKYIIIDEFQDIWIWRYKLVKSIINKNKSDIFCVWDDWQSIYRFAWWDLNIFTSFKDYFPYWEITFINKTYRYPQEVNDVTYKFITKNNFQIKKNLESWNKDTIEHPIFNIITYKDNIHRNNIIKQIIKKYWNNTTTIWRYKSDWKDIPSDIKFMTVHQSKWLESDYIIILNWNNWNMWFPSEIKDDSLLSLVLSKPDAYPFSEERRLFYVALTRARKKTFILTKELNKSYFVNELEEILDIKQNNIKEKELELCPKCKKWYLLDKNEVIYLARWCNRYPKCDYLIIDKSPVKKHKWLPLSKLDDKWLNWIQKTFINNKMVQYSIFYEIEKRKKKY